MARVFVVQERLYRDGTPRFDLTPAAEYGTLIPMLPDGPVALTPGPMVRKLRNLLRDFNDDDYLLAVGDTEAIAVASAVAAQMNGGRFNLLKWDKRVRSYLKIAVNLAA